MVPFLSKWGSVCGTEPNQLLSVCRPGVTHCGWLSVLTQQCSCVPTGSGNMSRCFLSCDLTKQSHLLPVIEWIIGHFVCFLSSDCSSFVGTFSRARAESFSSSSPSIPNPFPELCSPSKSPVLISSPPQQPSDKHVSAGPRQYGCCRAAAWKEKCSMFLFLNQNHFFSHHFTLTLQTWLQ